MNREPFVDYIDGLSEIEAKRLLIDMVADFLEDAPSSPLGFREADDPEDEDPTGFYWENGEPVFNPVITYPGKANA